MNGYLDGWIINKEAKNRLQIRCEATKMSSFDFLAPPPQASFSAAEISKRQSSVQLSTEVKNILILEEGDYILIPGEKTTAWKK